MGSNDTLKTAKRRIQAFEQSFDGFHDRKSKKPHKTERQKGKKVAREEVRNYKRETR